VRKKLVVNKETLRNLNARDLSGAQGGETSDPAGGGSYPCFSGDGQSCSNGGDNTNGFVCSWASVCSRTVN